MTKQEYFKLARELQAVAKRWGDRCNSDAGPTIAELRREIHDALTVLDGTVQPPEVLIAGVRQVLQRILDNMAGGFSAREATEIVRAALNGGNVLEAIARGMPDEEVKPPVLY